MQHDEVSRATHTSTKAARRLPQLQEGGAILEDSPPTLGSLGNSMGFASHERENMRDEITDDFSIHSIHLNMGYRVTLQRNNTVHAAGPEKARVHSHAITLDASRRAAALEQWIGTHPPEPLKFFFLLLLQVLEDSGSSGIVQEGLFF